jgi:hypothetical protein
MKVFARTRGFLRPLASTRPLPTDCKITADTAPPAGSGVTGGRGWRKVKTQADGELLGRVPAWLLRDGGGPMVCIKLR